jgi:hypothetical protein
MPTAANDTRPAYPHNSDEDQYNAFRKAEREWERENRVKFFSGLRVGKDGPVNAPSKAKERAELKAIEKQRHEIRLYCDKVARELKKGMPADTAGDCFFCSFTSDKPGGYDYHGIQLTNQRPSGPSSDSDHIQSHIEERYVMPSLLANALREKGYSDLGISLHLGVHEREGAMYLGNRANIEIVKRAVRTYLTKHTITGVATR